MKVAVTLLLASVAAQVYVASGWHKRPGGDHGYGDRGDRGKLDWGDRHEHGHGDRGDRGRGDRGHHVGPDIVNWQKRLNNFKVQIPGFLMPGVRIPGFMAEGWFPDFGDIDGTEGFVVGHKQFKLASSFPSFQVRFGQPGFRVNNRFVPLRNMRNVFEFYVYNRMHDRLQINGLPPLQIDYKDGIPPFYVQNVHIPGFAPDGLFPAFRFNTREDAGFEVDGKFKNVREFPGIKIVSFRPRLTLNGQKVYYEDLKMKLDHYFRTGGTVEKLQLEGFTVEKRKVRPTIQGFTIKGLNIPGFAVNGRFPSIKYEGRVPGFVISGQFVPGTEFEAFKIENGVPGLIVNGKWYPYDANLEKYLKSLGPKFEKLEIPGFTVQVEHTGPQTEAPPPTPPPEAPILPGYLGFVIKNGVKGFIINGKFVPGWKVPGFQIRGDQNGFVVDGVFWSLEKLEKEKPNFEFDVTLKVPEITFPSYTIRAIPGGGTLTGVTFKGYFVPSEKVKGFTVEHNVPGLTIKGKFVPISQIQTKFPGIRIESTDPERYPDLVFPGVVTEGGKEYLQIDQRKIPLDLVPGYEKAPDGTPSIKIDDEWVPIFQLPIRFPKFQLTIPAAEWPEIKFPGFVVHGGIPGFEIKGQWVPGTDIRGFQLRAGLPGFIIEGKFTPLDKVPPGFKLPQVLPRFTIRLGIPGLIVEGKFVPGDKIPNFKVEHGIPGFVIEGTFYPLNNLPEKFVIDVTPPPAPQPPVFEIRGGVPGLIVEGKWTPAVQFPGFTIRANIPGIVIEGKFVPIDKVDPTKVPKPEPPKPEPKQEPVYVIKGNIPGIIINGGFIPGDKLPGFKVEGNIPGITIEGKWVPLKELPKDFKWPDPTPQPSLTIVIKGSTPGIIFHGRFLPTTEIPGFEIRAGVPGIVLQGKFYPLTDLTEDNVPKKPEGIIRYVVKDGSPGIEINGKFYPSDKVPGFTIKSGIPGLTVKGVFYPLDDVLADRVPPEVTITIVLEPPKKKFPEFIIKGGVPGLLIDGEFVDADYVKDMYMLDLDKDGVDEPVFYIDGKYINLPDVPVKYPNYEIVVLKTKKSDRIPKFETRDGFPGLVINGEFIPGKYITDFVVENNVPGFKPKGEKFIPLQVLPLEKPGYMIEVNIPKPTVVPQPTVYNGVFGYIVNNVFYPGSRIPGVKVTGKWPEIEVPVVIPGYPGEKPKFTIKDYTPGFIVKGNKFIPLKDVPGVLFVGPDLVIPGPKTLIIPIFTKENKLPTIEFTFGIPGIDLTVTNGEPVTKPPVEEDTTTTVKPKPLLPEFVTLNGVPGLIIEGTFYPGTSIRDFKVEGTVPGFVIKDKFVPLLELPEKAPNYIIKIRDPNFPKYEVRNGVPGLVIFRKFVPHDWIKGMKIKNNEPYFTIKGKDVPLGDLPDQYQFEIEMPRGFKIEPTIAYGEIGFLVNDLFYPGSKIPGLKVQGDWPKVEVPGVKVPGHEKDTPTFTIVNFVPGFLFPDKSFVPAYQVPGVEFDGLTIIIPGAKIPTIKFPGFDFTMGIPGGTLEIPSEYVKPRPVVTTTAKPVDPNTPEGYPRYIVREGTPGLVINGKFVPEERIHRFSVKDGKPGFTYDGVWIPYKEVPQKVKEFTITVLPENWPRFTIKDGVPGLVMNKRFIPGKYFLDFDVKNNVPGFTIRDKFVPLDDLIEKEPDYIIQFKPIELDVKPTIYDGEIGFIVDNKFYPGSKIPGLTLKGEWPKVPVPGLKIPGYEKETPVFTIVDWVPGFLIPGQPSLPLIPAKKVPGVQFDGITIILPGAQIPTIQFPGFEFTLGFPGVQVDVPGAVDVKDFTTRRPTTTTLDPNAPYTAPPGFFPYVIVNGEPGLMIEGKFYPARKIRHFKVVGKIPGFDIDGTWVPYHDLPKHPGFKITVIPEGYPEYLVKNKRPGLVFGGKWWPAEWVKDFVVPHSDEEEPGFKVNGFFIPLDDLFAKAPGYKITINPPPINPQVTIINGEIGFIVENKFYPGSKIPGLTITGQWPKVPVPGFKIPGHESEIPLFTIKDFKPGFIVKPDKFIPAKDVPGVRFDGINIVLEGARIPTIQFPGFDFTLGIPGLTLDVDPSVVIEIKPTEPPQLTPPEFVVIDKVPGLRIDGKFYPVPLIQDFTINVNEPGFIISGEFVPLKDIRYKYPDYTIKIRPPVNPIVIRPEFAIIKGVIGVIINDIFYPGNKIPGIQTTSNWPEVEVPGLKIKGHEDETPVLTVKDFVIGFLVKKPQPKFIPVTEVPQVKIEGTTITIEGAQIPTIQFPGFTFTLGIPGIDIQLPDGEPVSRPTNPPVSKDKLPEYKVVNNVPGLVIHEIFIPGVFIKDFIVIGDVPGFMIKDKHVPLKDLPKDAPDYVITINLKVRPVLTFKNGIIGFEINNQFIPGNQIPGLTIEGSWPEIPAIGVEIPGHEKETPVFTVRDWVPGFVVKGEFIPATKLPGFNIVNNVIVIPGFTGLIKFPSIDLTNIINILKPRTTPAPLTKVTPPTHFLGFDIVDGIPVFVINGKKIPATKVPNFRIQGNIPGFIILGQFVPLTEIELKFPGFRIILNGDDVQVHNPEQTEAPGTEPTFIDIIPAVSTLAPDATTGRPVPTTVTAVTKPDKTIDWNEFGKIIYNIAYKWERIRETFGDTCNMEKEVTIETVLNKKLLDSNAINKIRFFNEPFGHFLEVLMNDYIPKLAKELDLCGKCGKTPLLEFIEKTIRQFCVDLRKQPLIPFLPDVIPPVLRTAMRKYDVPSEAEVDAVKKVRREVALRVISDAFWSERAQ